MCRFYSRIMNIYFGNVTFDKVFDETGYKLTEEDRNIWNKYHSNKADLSEKDNCFHMFSMPLEIHFKGDEAKEALLKMFTPDKCIEAKGYFNVIRKEQCHSLKWHITPIYANKSQGIKQLTLF